jgi:hemerythrin
MDRSLSLDITSLDSEHDALASAVHGLFADHTPSRDEFLAALDGLRQAVAAHFAHEERVMRNIGLPEYAAHCSAHRSLLAELQGFRGDVERGFADRTVEELRSFLNYWLFRHISQDDMRIRAHLDR